MKKHDTVAQAIYSQHITAETKARNAKKNNQRTNSKDDKIKGQKTTKMEFTKRNTMQGEGSVNRYICLGQDCFLFACLFFNLHC